MVTENVRYINEEPPGKEQSRECLDLLRDLSAEQLAQLRGILLKASLDSLGTTLQVVTSRGFRLLVFLLKSLKTYLMLTV